MQTDDEVEFLKAVCSHLAGEWLEDGSFLGLEFDVFEDEDERTLYLGVVTPPDDQDAWEAVEHFLKDLRQYLGPWEIDGDGGSVEYGEDDEKHDIPITLRGLKNSGR